MAATTYPPTYLPGDIAPLALPWQRGLALLMLLAPDGSFWGCCRCLIHLGELQWQQYMSAICGGWGICGEAPGGTVASIV
jgi:hypothetical protein